MRPKIYPRAVYFLLAALLAGCSGGPARYESDAPPAERPRVEVLSANKYLITIGHNAAGEKVAFRYAYEKCQSFGKHSVYLTTTQQYGSELISTWKCVDLDSP